jgi:hypothetical protein
MALNRFTDHAFRIFQIIDTEQVTASIKIQAGVMVSRAIDGGQDDSAGRAANNVITLTRASSDEGHNGER